MVNLISTSVHHRRHRHDNAIPLFSAHISHSFIGRLNGGRQHHLATRTDTTRYANVTHEIHELAAACRTPTAKL